MKALLRHSLSLSSLLAVAVIVVLAVAVSVARLLLPLAADYRPQIEAAVSRHLGQPVRFDDLQAEWSGWGPRLHLTGVSLLDAAGERRVLAMDELVVDPDLLASLLERRLVLRRLTVRGTDLHIERRADGSLQVRGLSLPGGAPGPAGGFSGLTDLSFTLVSSRVRWVDEVTGADYLFPDVNLRVVLHQPRLQLAGVVTLPEGLGRQLHLVLDVVGELVRPAGWKARVYAKAEGVNLARLPSDSLARLLGVSAGEADLESWSEWQGARLQRAHGRLSARGLAWAGGAGARLEAVDTEFLVTALAQGGWRLDLRGLQVARAGRVWPRSSLSAEYRRDAAGGSLRAHVDFLRLQDLWPVAAAQGGLPEDLRARLTALAPEGDLHDTQLALRWPAEDGPALLANGEFEDLGIQASAALPGLQGLDGQFSLDGRSGELVLDSAGVRLALPRFFAEPRWLDRLGARLRWRWEDGRYRLTGEDIRAENADLQARARLRLELGGGRPAHLDLRMAYANLDVAQARHYLPSILPQGTRSWLERALVSGRIDSGELLFFGRPADFPFRNGEGLFETRARLRDATLDYRDGWPALRGLAGELLFRNAGMEAQVEAGRVFNARIDAAQVRIQDMHRARLQVEARASGPLGSVLRFLRESPLGRGREALLADTEAEGSSTLNLALRLPLSRRLQESGEVRSVLEFESCDLGLRSADVALTDLRGRLQVGDQGIQAEGITGRFRGNPVRITASTGDDGEMHVDAVGEIGIQDLLHGLGLPSELLARIRGRSEWLARVSIPRGGQAATGARLSLRSDLAGVAVDLPEPLNKPAETRRPVSIGLGLSRQQPSTLHVEDTGGVSAVLQLSPGPRSTIRRGELRFNAGRAQLPAVGIRLAGRLPSVSVEAWRAALGGEAAGGGLAGRVNALELSMDRLQALGWQFRNVRISALKDETEWRALVNTSLLSGTVHVPLRLREGTPLSMELEHLDLDAPPQRSDQAADKPLDPRQLPALRVTSERFTWSGRRFRDLRLEATPLRDGLQIHALQLATKHLRLRGFGDWRVLISGRQQTSLHYALESDDVGRAQKELGMEGSVADGEGTLEGDLRWPAGPLDFAWAQAQGKARLKLEDGRLREIEPGAGGRLLSLFNVSSLLSGGLAHLGQLFNQGFSFDVMEGNFTLAEGNLYSNDLTIRGPAAVVQIQGRTGLAARDFDQRVTVTPQVTSSLPVAGFFLGGGTPVGVGIGLVLDKVLGKSLNPRIEYRVTGPWDAPAVKILEGPGEETSEDE